MRVTDSAALAHLAELRTRFGITRIGETTRLHRIALPTFCAVVPESASDVTIYNGRGLTRERAILGAVMEAVERQVAAVCAIPAFPMRADRCGAFDVEACGLRPAFAAHRMPFVEARNLRSDETMYVPQALVQYPWRGASAFPVTHTNGLAAAFDRQRAVHHALLEAVERHLYAVTHARAHLRPRRLLREILGRADLPFVDDPVREIAQPTGDTQADAACAAVTSAGLRLRLVALFAPPLPPGVLASIYDPERGDLRAGLGCSWSPAGAVVRAVTEAAQAHAADVQAARENILRVHDPPSAFTSNTRRQMQPPYGRWYFDGPTQRISLSALAVGPAPRSSAEGFRALAGAVHTVAGDVAVVDLTPGERTFCVVRVIVPALETTLIDGRMGTIVRSIIDAAA